MSRLPSRSVKQFKIVWLMLAILVAAMDFALARTLMRRWAPDPSVKPILVSVLCYNLLGYLAYRHMIQRNQRRVSGRKYASLHEVFDTLIMIILFGLPMIYAILSIFDLLPRRIL